MRLLVAAGWLGGAERATLVTTIATNHAIRFADDLQSLVHAMVALWRRGLNEGAVRVPPSYPPLLFGEPPRRAADQPPPTERETDHYEK